VSRIWIVAFLFACVLSGCSLAGDLTPPPALSTAQASQSVLPSTPQVTPAQVTPAESFPLTSPNIERGAQIYLEMCADCHGAGGAGDGPQAESLSNPPTSIGSFEIARDARLADWYSIVTDGRDDRFMPAFQDLSDDERWDVVAYALTLSREAGDIAQGGELFADLCIDCHGPQGSGSSTAPVLADIQFIAQHSARELFETISGGVPSGMPAFEDSLLEEERWSLIRYIMELSFVGDDGYPTGEEDGSVGDTLTEGVVQGRIINGTESGTIPNHAEVTLHGFDSQEEILTETAITDESGEYRFSGVAIELGRIFLVTVEYGGTIYSSDVAHISDDGVLDLPLMIYESTTELSAVRVDRLHTILQEPIEGILQVTELWILSNLGEYTVASDMADNLFAIRLPTGATNLQFESGASGGRFLETDGGFIDLLPILPGRNSHEIAFSFTLPLEDTLEFSQPIDYPVEAVVLLSQEDELALEDQQLVDEGVRQIAGISFHNYTLDAIDVGEELEFSVIDIKSSAVDSAGGIGFLELAIGISILGVSLMITGLWWYRRNAMWKDDAGVVSQIADRGGPEGIDIRESLIRQLVDLDETFEAGGMDEDRYRTQRRRLKSDLLEVLRKAEDDSG
jgi:mono/diheme cytochrome c family protein